LHGPQRFRDAGLSRLSQFDCFEWHAREDAAGASDAHAKIQTPRRPIPEIGSTGRTNLSEMSLSSILVFARALEPNAV
jgi:hypothetical protein